ncbi:hypothetical protein BDD12DRAFT_804815 [Trichophaea hybrida]|nr:hypothetical protein BDD12DRAFT_804815 [Trichophaea hybrida]
MRFIRNKKKGLKEFFGTVGTVGSALDKLNAPSKAAAMVDGWVSEGNGAMVHSLHELEENGNCSNTLRQVLESVAKIYTYARPEGIVAALFFNTRQGTRDVTPEKVEGLLGEIEYSGLTMIGTQLKKILEPFLFNCREGMRMQKPLLVVVITDGDVCFLDMSVEKIVLTWVKGGGRETGVLKKTITNCIAREKEGPLLGEHAVASYFARVGDDEGAKDLMESLDNDKSIGNWIYCFPGVVIVVAF